MNRYLLSTLVSLALSSPWAVAEESAHEHTAPATPLNVEQIRAQQQQSMQELMRKIHEIQDPAERQRLTVAHIQDMQQHLQEMQMMLGPNVPPSPGPTYAPAPQYGYPMYGPGGPNVVYLAPLAESTPAAEGKKKECDMKKKMKEKMEGDHEGHEEKPAEGDTAPSLARIEQRLARIVELLEKNFASQDAK